MTCNMNLGGRTFLFDRMNSPLHILRTLLSSIMHIEGFYCPWVFIEHTYIAHLTHIPGNIQSNGSFQSGKSYMNRQFWCILLQ